MTLSGTMVSVKWMWKFFAISCQKLKTPQLEALIVLDLLTLILYDNNKLSRVKNQSKTRLFSNRYWSLEENRFLSHPLVIFLIHLTDYDNSEREQHMQVPNRALASYLARSNLDYEDIYPEDYKKRSMYRKRGNFLTSGNF